MYVVEAIPDSARQSLAIVSAYMKRNNGGNVAVPVLNMPSNQNSPQLTPEAPAGAPASTTDSIPQATTSVNGETNLPGDRPTMPESTLPPMRESVDWANHPYGDNRQQNR